MISASVSVVMPTFNRCKQLQSVIGSYLASQSVQELIIVDDASADDTGAWAASLASSDGRVRYLRNEVNRGLPASRNVGVAHSMGVWVLHTEDDLALGEGCLETLLEHAKQQHADVIAGRRIWVRIGESPLEALRRANAKKRRLLNESLLEHDSETNLEHDIETPLLNATMLVRRSVATSIQHYEPLGGQSSWREDSDYQLQALETGHRLVFCPHAICFHYSRSSQSFGSDRLRSNTTYAYRVYRNNLVFLRRHQDYLRRHHPRSLILGSPELSAIRYGIYRTVWLFGVEIMRYFRTRRHGGFNWK